MAKTTETGIAGRFQREMLEREARAEKFACLLWVAVILLTYSLFLLAGNFKAELHTNISLLVFTTVPGFILVYLLIRRGNYHPLLAYFNSFLQLCVVSGAIYFDTLAYGAEYALSSMPPLAYGLVIMVTAFRLRPAMGIFAGSVAAAQFLAIYVLVARSSPQLTPELLAAVPSLDWEVTYMKVVILLGMGIAGSFSAYSLRRELYNFIDSAQKEMRLHHSLGRYVSSQVADALVAGEDGTLPTRKLNVAVMFCDLRNFTRFSNAHQPDQVRLVVNAFFDQAAQCISDENGVINKFLGDGFLAIFGLFDSAEDPRVAATRAALAVLSATQSGLAKHQLGVGMALNYGEVIAGEIGSEGRCEFTVLGNAVNVAARLEGLNRELQTRLLATRDFYEALPAELVLGRSYGEFAIRGISGATEVFELLPGRL